jgi:CRP/FNR family transcriptional regulator
MPQGDTRLVLHDNCPVVQGVALVGGHRCKNCHMRMQSVCSALQLEELFENEHLSKPLCFAPKSALLREGVKRESVYTITAGVVRLSRTLPDGQRQIVGFALAGDFLGLELTEHVNFSAEAITPVNACQFRLKDFAELLRAKPNLMKRFQEITSIELVHAQDQMVIMGRKNAAGKVAAFLISLRDRLAKIEHVVVNVPLAMTRTDIGDYLGLTVETVSRTMSKFAREKMLVITPDGVRLLEPNQLRIMGEQ